MKAEFKIHSVSALRDNLANSAGQLMDRDSSVTIGPHLSVAEALDQLRSRGTLPKDTDQVFAADAAGHYLGAIPLTRLLSANLEKRLEALLQREGPRIYPDTPATEVARLFEHLDLVSAPVTDADGKLLGRIGAEAIVDFMVRSAEVSARRMGGAAVRDSLFARPFFSTRIRTPWLAFGMIGALLTAFLVHRFETSIATLAALAALGPIIASMGGVVAMQTATLTIRGLARGQIASDNAWAVLRREFGIAALGGLLLGAIILIGVGLWLGHWWIGAAAGMSLVLSFVVASAVGVFVPLTVHKFGRDPALAAGWLTTTTDVVGYTLLLALATVVLTW